MGEIKNRSLRLDDENDVWIRKLPGKTINEAVTALRERFSGEEAIESAESTAILEILELVRSLPDMEGVKEAVMEGIREFRGQAAKKVELPASGRPEEIPGVTRGLPSNYEAPVRRETAMERLAREKAEREARARGRSSIGDDPSFCVDGDYVQD